MANIFPRSTNRLPARFIAAVLLVASTACAFAYFYLTPGYARVGYQPVQPVPFDHSLHVAQLGLDCRYCHGSVDKSEASIIPDAATCMNCHAVVKPDSPALAPVRDSVRTGTPIPWIRVHRTPDYVFFNHAVHVRRGVSCVECHGRVDQMREVFQAKSLSMGFCLDCHKAPTDRLRPLDKVTDLGWTPERLQSSLPVEARIETQAAIHPSTSCSACHR